MSSDLIRQMAAVTAMRRPVLSFRMLVSPCCRELTVLRGGRDECPCGKSYEARELV